MLRDEIAKYTELSGNDGEHTPIGIIGAYLDGYDKGLELSVSENPNKWIPVSERLPEKDGQYLVTYDREDEIKVDVSYFDKYGFWIGNVDAWMPLPEAYKAEREVNEMTREEAITALGDRNILLWGMSWEEQKHYSKALDMAILALKERKGKGKWIDSSNGWTCSICNRDSKSDTNFCPHCGAKMKVR